MVSMHAWAHSSTVTLPSGEVPTINFRMPSVCSVGPENMCPIQPSGVTGAAVVVVAAAVVEVSVVSVPSTFSNETLMFPVVSPVFVKSFAAFPVLEKRMISPIMPANLPPVTCTVIPFDNRSPLSAVVVAGGLSVTVMRLHSLMVRSYSHAAFPRQDGPVSPAHSSAEVCLVVVPAAGAALLHTVVVVSYSQASLSRHARLVRPVHSSAATKTLLPPTANRIANASIG